MPWIEFHQALERHPKTRALADKMGWSIDETIGKLARFWWWCLDYAWDGDLRKFRGQIGTLLGLVGEAAQKFEKAMVKVGFIDARPIFRIHDWWDHAGYYLGAKYKQKPDKWQKVRARYSKEKRNRSKGDSNNSSENAIPSDRPTDRQTYPGEDGFQQKGRPDPEGQEIGELAMEIQTTFKLLPMECLGLTQDFLAGFKKKDGSVPSADYLKHELKNLLERVKKYARKKNPTDPVAYLAASIKQYHVKRVSIKC